MAAKLPEVLITLLVLQIHIVPKTIHGFKTMYKTSKSPAIMADATSCQKSKMSHKSHSSNPLLCCTVRYCTVLYCIILYFSSLVDNFCAVQSLRLLEQPHTLVCGCSYILPLWFISLFIFFISASLISAVSAPIWLKFGTLTGSWCNLWSPVPNGG